MTVTGFEWDEGNRRKCRKHGISIGEIEAMFRQSLSVFPDPAHSHHEERFKAIGKGQEGRNILIVFTIRRRRESRLIRPISARYMHRKEVEHYEKETARSQKR
jgi:uncharacterized DUF497 family protein